MEETAWYPSALPASSIGHDSHKTLLEGATSRPVKQGWILQKRSFIPFSGLAWKPKYMVLLTNKSSSNGPLLQVFDQCDQSKPPRCEVALGGLGLRTMEERQGAFRFPFSRRRLSILGMTPSGGKEVILFYMYSYAPVLINV
jgi:hypothetical protein